MITDSCDCERSCEHGCCKGLTRSYQSARCPICDRNKVKRRCQSEGLYQEGDPLKELNWCCDRGCDLINRSSKCSQIKKTELEMNEKKVNFSEDNDVEVGNSRCGIHRKHHSRPPYKERLDAEIQLQNSGGEINSGLELTKSQRIQKYYDSSSSSDRCKLCLSLQENSSLLKYHPIGDYHDMLSTCKTKDSSEKEKSSEMREIYLKEMEILRSKLSLLKDGIACDGKRMRQRSESEPGFAELPGGVPKKARDISPKMKLTGRKLPGSPDLNHSLKQLSVKKSMPFQRECKSLSPSSMKTVEKDGFRRVELAKNLLSTCKDIKEIVVHEYDNVEGGTYNKSKADIDLADSEEDDDESIASNDTLASSDSNTPSKIGESLGSITLNEVPQKDKPLKCLKKKSESVPACEKISENMSVEKEELFRTSLFPNVPPYVKFFMHDLKGPTLPVDIRRYLKWRLSSITPIVIRRTLLNSGFKLVRRNYEHYYHLIYIPPHRNEGINPPFPRSSRISRKPLKESNDWTGQWGKHMKSFVFKTLKDFQKLNHFPGTFQIGRKDRLWKNLYRLMMKFGKKEFGFIPKTYILPHDRKLLRTAWEKASGPGKGQWIVKPPAAARGTGIKVVHRWGQIPKKKSLIVQKYIAQPYLINGSKFDLRLYVLMTSIHPLRIYMYDDGLVRFASVKYSEDVECLSNRFMHLTNYSINKLSNQYQVNADATSCNGHKWSLKSLWTYLAKQGVNVKALRKNLTDLVIKTVISGESNINVLSRNNLPSRYCSYELFGIDVLLDHSLKPWLLEVNISPSLHSASPLDLAVKGPLVKELLNIAGFQIPAKLTKEQEESFLADYGLREETDTICYDKRLYWMNLSKEEKAKQESFHNSTRKEYLNAILENLTPDDVRHLIQFEDELTQLCRFEKIFPTSHTHVYHQFFESPRYYNMLLDAWETKYQKNRTEGIDLLSSLCRQKLHLNVSNPGGDAKSSPSPNDSIVQALQETEIESDFKDERESNPEPEVEDSSLPGSGSPSPEAPGSPANEATKSGMASAAATSTPTTVVCRRPKANSNGTPIFKSPLPEEEDSQEETKAGGGSESHPPLIETRCKVAPEMQQLQQRQNGLKFASDPKQEKLKQFPNCKLENSIVNESLTNGKSVLSPSKHIRNASIKMNSSS